MKGGGVICTQQQPPPTEQARVRVVTPDGCVGVCREVRICEGQSEPQYLLCTSGEARWQTDERSRLLKQHSDGIYIPSSGISDFPLSVE